MKNRKRRSALHTAIIIKFEPAIHLLLDWGGDVNEVNRKGNSLLQLAIRHNTSLNVVAKLLEKGADISMKNKKGKTALQIAMDSRFKSALNLLIEKGADLTVDRGCETPLHFAIRSSDSELFKQVLIRSVDVDIKNNHGNSPLHVAVMLLNEKFVKDLLEKGAQVDVKNILNETPLAISTTSGSCEIFDLLLSRKNDVNVKNEFGNTPLHFAANQHAVLVDKVLSQGAVVNIQNENGETPLHVAVENEKEDIVEKLLDVVGVGIELKNRNGKTALHCAAQTSEVLVRLLLDKGADVDCIDDNGQTPLHLAVNHRIKPVCQMLLSRGADVNANDYQKQTPLHIASKHNVDMVRFLLNSGARVNMRDMNGKTPLFVSTDNRFYSVCKELPKNDDDVNVNGNRHVSPHVSELSEKICIAEALLERGADVDLQNESGETPLMNLLRHGCQCMIKFFDILIARGANVNIKDEEGLTPLHIAVLGGSNVSVVKELIAKGAKVNEKDDCKQTALHLAVQGFHVDHSTVMALLENGAAVNAEDEWRNTAVDNAIFIVESKQSLEELLNWGGWINNDQSKTFNLNTSRIPTRSVFEKHLIKKECAGLSSDNIDCNIDLNEWHLFQDDCLKEIQQIKAYKLDHNSLHDLFTKCNNPRYVSNSKFEEVIKSPRLNIDFPIYASLLRATYTRAKWRFQLLDNAQHSFKVALPIEIVQMILTYLPDEDLRSVVKLN